MDELRDSIPTIELDPKKKPVAPLGYKPVRHKKCGWPVAWVKDHVVPHTRAKAEDVMFFDGSSPEPSDPIVWHCSFCGRNVPGMFEVTIA